ncbi:MAG: patatin-like phospholipase family protein [Rhodospirillaceae bacterium]
MVTKRPIKRAIALAGGGPTVGLSIGSLKSLRRAGIEFEVWSCACIGAWLGVVYNQADPGREVEQSIEFFRNIFRPDAEYARFPIAGVFAPDFQAMVNDSVGFVLNPKSYNNLLVPEAIKKASDELLKFAADPSQWSFANLNSVFLNDVLAVNPVSRFMTSLIYLSSFNGLARIFYPDSSFLKSIQFKRLYEPGKPAIYYNSYNLTKQRLELFTNKQNDRGYGSIRAETLCACSALPYIETPVKIGDDIYCEGATIDTVNFEDLMQNYPDLDEVWVSRILDRKQVRPAENLYDSLNNLVMLFASTTSEDDVKLFKYKLKDTNSTVRVIEIPVNHHVNYDWTYSNLDHSIRDGERATDAVLKAYVDTP